MKYISPLSSEGLADAGPRLHWAIADHSGVIDGIEVVRMYRQLFCDIITIGHPDNEWSEHGRFTDLLWIAALLSFVWEWKKKGTLARTPRNRDQPSELNGGLRPKGESVRPLQWMSSIDVSTARLSALWRLAM